MKRVHFGFLLTIAFLMVVSVAVNVVAEEDEIELWTSTTNAREATWAFIGETGVALMFLPAQNATDVSVDVTDCPMFRSELHITVPHIDAGARWIHELFFDLDAEPGDHTIKIAVTYIDDQGGSVVHTVDHPFEYIRAIEVRSLTVSDDEWNAIDVEIETFVFLDILGVSFDADKDLVLTDSQETRRDVDPGVHRFSTKPKTSFSSEGDHSVQVRLGGSAGYHSFTVLNQTVDITIEEETNASDYIGHVLFIISIAIFVVLLIKLKRSRSKSEE